MIILAFLLGLVIGGLAGARLYYSELKNLEKRKSELSVMYYQQLNTLLNKIETLESELRHKRK